MTKTQSKMKCALVPLFVAFFFPAVGNASSMPSAARQAGVFHKVFKFSKALRGKKPKVLAVYTADTKYEINAIVAAFSKRGIPTQAVEMSKLASRLRDGLIIYTLSDAEMVGKLCTENKKLSITGNSELVEQGGISVGVAEVSGKIVIKVHLPKSKAEGHIFAPTFLRMAKVIR